jgi:hypothetical protein
MLGQYECAPAQDLRGASLCGCIDRFVILHSAVLGRDNADAPGLGSPDKLMLVVIPIIVIPALALELAVLLLAIWLVRWAWRDRPS